MRDTRRLVILAGMAQLCLVSGLAAQPRPPRMEPRRPPPPEGRQVETADGDTVVITDDDRVIVVRQRLADVRVVFDAEHRAALVIADWGTPVDAKPDGRVNRTWLFRELEGAWPLDARWQGRATIVEPESLRGASERVAPTLSIETPAGPVVFMTGRPAAPACPFPPAPYSGISTCLVADRRACRSMRRNGMRGQVMHGGPSGRRTGSRSASLARACRPG